jgi:hypothetical protein
MELSEKDKQHFHYLQKGYDGEVRFDSFIENLQCECIIINDLLLKLNNTVLQIDSLIITPEILHFYEVKNYEGDFYYDSDKMYTKSKSEINNPLNQLNRGVSLLRQLLQNLGYHIRIDPSVIFINPAFTLYQSPLTKPFIFPTQMDRYIRTLNMIPSKLQSKHKKLAEQLVSLHCTESPFQQLPRYSFEQLKKGIPCVKCASFTLTVEGTKCVCQKCGYREVVADSVMRNVKEYQLLFPERKITTGIINEWCGGDFLKKRISIILAKNFKKVGARRWAFYE